MTVAFKLDGSEISLKFADLGGRLANLFNLNLESVSELGGFLYFVFSLGEDARLHVATAHDYEVLCKEAAIRITGRLTWNFRKIPHALITGGTGSGKTFFITYLMGAFFKIGANIKIVDPKHSDISEFGRYVGEENVASEPNVIARLLREADEAMNARYEEFKRRDDNGFGKDYFDYGYKPTVIFFDEMTAFMGSADSKLAKEVNGYLMDIIMKGRQAGFFMVLTMQRPDAEYLKAAIRDNLGMRIALGHMSADGYSMVFGNSARDLQLKNYQKGDGFIYIDGQTSIPRQFSAPFLAGNVEDMFSQKEEAKCV